MKNYLPNEEITMNAPLVNHEEKINSTDFLKSSSLQISDNVLVDENNENYEQNLVVDQKYIPRNLSETELVEESKPEGKVLVLYTGGTIGMVRNSNGALAPVADAFVKTLRKYHHLHDTEYANERFGPDGPLVLPMNDSDTRRVIYEVIEYAPLLDSSNMKMDDWIKIAQDIKKYYEKFDGFVVLHGTDTLSYTASALSFMLEALGKIVILTGSQLPLFSSRSDGVDNFMTSLIIAANYSIPEVCIFFGSRLMRGNRTIKSSVSSFDAFNSPNCAPLAVAGIDINVDYSLIFRSCMMEKFHVHTVLNRNVTHLRMFPSITADCVRLNLKKPIEGVVLDTYGAGNVPSNCQDIINEFKAATSRGVIIVNITQCVEGSVKPVYEVGTILMDAGVTSGFDMTPEAALTKLCYILSKTDWNIDKKREMMETNLRGELTVEKSIDWHLNEAISRSFKISSSEKLKKEGEILFALINVAVKARDKTELENLKRSGADISLPNSDGRTALHIACCEGDVSIVLYLLKMGASVHMKDRFNRTPLTDAVEFDNHEIIKLLVQCGAHLHENHNAIGERLCSAAANGKLARLQSYYLAGADLSQPDVSERTALQLAAQHGHVEILRFLLKHIDEVETKNSDEAIKLIKNYKCKALKQPNPINHLKKWNYLVFFIVINAALFIEAYILFKS